MMPISRVRLPLAGLPLLLCLHLAGCGDASSATPTVGEDIASACVRSAACELRAYPRVRECLANYEQLNGQSGGAYQPLLACVNEADDCNAMAACHGRGQPCDASFPAFCDGDAAVSCDLFDNWTYRLDCAAVGGTCEVSGGFTARCKRGDSSPPDPLPDLECPGGACQPVGGSCTSDAFDRCGADGGLEACVSGAWVRFECAALGLGPCQQQSLGFGRCTPPR